MVHFLFEMKREEYRYLKELGEIIPHQVKAYLVGGFLRDFLIKRKPQEIIDVDIVLDKQLEEVSKKFADRIKAAWFYLDPENGVIRIVKKTQKQFQFDFSLLKGNDIKQDLSYRDFTINALAIDLDDFLKERFNFIDPFQGKDDLKKRIVRVIKEQNLITDPIRILRAFSISAQLDFEIEKGSLQMLKRNVSLLETEAGERITEELFKILSQENSFKYFAQLHEAKVLDYIFDSWESMRNLKHGPYHHLSVDLHSIFSLEMLEKLYQELDKTSWPELNQYLNQIIADRRKRREILKLATLLHDIGKPFTCQITNNGKIKFTGHEKIGKEIVGKISLRLRLSRQERKMLKDMLYYHLRPGFLVDCIDRSHRALLRYLRDTAQEAISIILLSIADKEATRGPFTSEKDRIKHKRVLLEIINDYFKKEEVKLPRLVSGWDIMEILGIKPGPIVGKILHEIEEAQVERKVSTREEALIYIRKIYQKLSDDIEKNA